jgi:MOSC domain-containing protein YiiM
LVGADFVSTQETSPLCHKNERVMSVPVTPRHEVSDGYPTSPCYKLALRFDRDDMIMHFLTSQRSGFYFSVIEEGEVQAGSKVEVLSRDPHRVAVVDIVRLYLRQARDPDLLHRAMNVSALQQNWKAELTVRVDHA